MKNILHQTQIKKGSFLKFKQSGSIRIGRRGHASVPWWDPIFSSILPLPFLSSWWKKYFGCLPEALLFWDIAPALAWICVLWVSRWEVSWISTSASVLPRGLWMLCLPTMLTAIWNPSVWYYTYLLVAWSLYISASWSVDGQNVVTSWILPFSKYESLMLKPWSRPCCHSLGGIVAKLVMFRGRTRANSVLEGE